MAYEGEERRGFQGEMCLQGELKHPPSAKYDAAVAPLHNSK